MMTLYIYIFLIWFQGTILWGNKTIRILCVIIRAIHNFCCPHFAISIKFEDRFVKIWPLDGCSSDLDGGETNRQTVCLFVSLPPRLKLNYINNDSFYRDYDILHVQMERAIHTQPPASHPSPPRQRRRPVQRWPNIGTTASMMGQRRADPRQRPGGWCHSQWNRRPRTVSECNQSSHKSLGKLHISIYILVWICDPALRVYAFSKFSTRIQYHLSDIPCTIYAMMIWRYL